jgi:hypothetical protein
MTLKLATATLKLPTVLDPNQWRKSGDPRPIIKFSDRSKIEVISEERTPYTVSLKGVAMTNGWYW